MANPAVSIIIPVRNNERFVGETLASIKEQTLPDFEVIVVDDGSTDSTCAVVENAFAGDERFTLVKKEHTNAGDSRNVGMAAAHGDYLLFFDADDLMRPNMLETLLAAAKEYDADVTVCQASSFNDDGTVEDVEAWSATKVDDWGPFGAEFDTVYAGVELPYSPFFTCMGWAWDKLLRHSFVTEHGLRFQSIESTNDAMFVLAALALANRVVFIPDSLVRYRKHPASISATRSKHPHNAKIAVDALCDLLRAHPDVWEACEWDCLDWGLSHLRWNYRTLRDDARAEAFADYREAMLSMTERSRRLGFHNCEEEWVRDAFAANPGCESMYVADTAMDYGYVIRERDNLLAQLEAEREMRRSIEESTSFKVGRTITAIPRKLKNHGKRES